jgi:hypothetical protein
MQYYPSHRTVETNHLYMNDFCWGKGNNELYHCKINHQITLCATARDLAGQLLNAEQVQFSSLNFLHEGTNPTNSYTKRKSSTCSLRLCKIQSL